MNGIRCARASGRLTAGAVCVLALCCAVGGLSAPVAAASRSRAGHSIARAGHSMAHAAHELAVVVKHSAGGAGRGRSSGVVTLHCCGARLLDVYYRAHPRARVPWHGTYELKLRRRGAFLESVGVSFFPTAARWAFGGAGVSVGPRYQFTISSPRGRTGWRVAVSDSFVGCALASSPAKQCEGFSDELSVGEGQLARRRFRTLFKQALKVVGKARRHVPISSRDLVAVGAAARAAKR